MNFDNYFQTCRNSVYRSDTKEFLLSRFLLSDQEKDLSVPPNCEGYGRVRHFKRFIAENWGLDPLPIDPAIKALKLPDTDLIEAQVFQIASCNVNCWYCFVPDALKHANETTSKWFSASEMIELFCKDNNCIKVIDLSGGNPELVPEWILETMKALIKKNLQDKVYLWSDDTLTTDYTFKYLKKDEINFFKSYKNYGKVCCFKGFDAHSFSFNTKLPMELFYLQFENFAKYLELGLDLYAYVTFTTDNAEYLDDKIGAFIDKLIKCHPLLPLRTVPLKISIFTPVKARLTPQHEISLNNQQLVHNEWKKQLKMRYSAVQLNTRIPDVSLYD